MGICPKIALNLKLTIVGEKNFNMILVSEGILLQDHKIILLYVTLYLLLTQNYYELLMFEIHTSEYFQSTKKIDKSHIPNCILGHNLSMFPLFGTKMCLPFNFKQWNYDWKKNFITTYVKLLIQSCHCHQMKELVSLLILQKKQLKSNLLSKMLDLPQDSCWVKLFSSSTLIWKRHASRHIGII